jgi:hypothetical protein
MGVFTRSHNPHGQTVVTTTTTTTKPHGTHGANAGYARKPTLMQRLKGNSKSHTTKTHVAAPRQKRSKIARSNGVTKNGTPRRKTSLGDKVSGMMMKLKGSATHRPGEKAAGTRRMRGTDGRGSRRLF